MASPKTSSSRAALVAAALVVILNGGDLYEVDAFVLPSGLATQRNLFTESLLKPKTDQEKTKPVWKPLGSFRFIKGETTYGDLVQEGSINNGMLGGGQALGGGTASSMGGNSFRTRRLGRRASNRRSWWSEVSGFSKNTATTVLAAGSLQSWPVLEADDLRILVKKGDDEDDNNNDFRENNPSAFPTSSKVRAKLERWERDIALPVVGRDGYPVLGNEMDPSNNRYNNNQESNDRCTQSITLDVANGDVYPFSGTISVPPPLTVEDAATGNQQTVMMVLNNPDENDDESTMQYPEYDEYGTEIPKAKPSPIEAKLEPLYKSPDEKYAEAQQKQQQQQQPQYDDYGNEIYNPQQQMPSNPYDFSTDKQESTIPSQGYQSFELDANDPASGKIKISLEREGGSSGSTGFGSSYGGSSGPSTEATVEIRHGFRDQYGNPYGGESSFSSSGQDDEADKRISFEVSTLHPEFSTVVDTMPAMLLAKHALPSINDLSFVQPYLEVRIVNNGGQSLKAGVQSYLPQYKPQTAASSQQQERKQRERQKLEQRQQLQRGLSSQSSVKADDPFLLVDSAQSTTSTRRMNRSTSSYFGEQPAEGAYVRASSRNNNNNRRSSSFNTNRNGGVSIDEMWSTGSSPNPRRPAPNYSNSNNYNNGYDDSIDTIATPKGGRVLSADNDFTRANGSSKNIRRVTSAMMVPGYGYGNNGFQSVEPTTRLQSFGGNSGDASGMQQPFQNGRSYSSSSRQPTMQQSQFLDDFTSNGMPNFGEGGSMMQPQDSYQVSSRSPVMQSQQPDSNGRTFFEDSREQQPQNFQNFSGSSRSPVMQSQFPDSNGRATFGESTQQRQGSTQSMQSLMNGRGNNGRFSSGGGLQQPFEQQTSPKTTRPPQLRRQQQQRVRSSGIPSGSNTIGTGGAFGGNGNVIGNGVIAGRPSSTYSSFGNDSGNRGRSSSSNRMNDFDDGRNNRAFGDYNSNNRDSDFGDSRNSGFGGRSVPSRNSGYPQASSSSRFDTGSQSSSFTPSPSNNFGDRGRNDRNNNRGSGAFGEGKASNLFGSIKERLEENDTFSRVFGGDKKKKNNQNRNNSGFGNSDNNNSGSPFGNLGAPPQTRGNSKNPFANLNGEKSDQEQQQASPFQSNNNNRNNGGFGGINGRNNDAFGGANGSTNGNGNSAPKNPFAGLNGNKNGSSNNGFGGSSVSGIGDYGSSSSSGGVIDAEIDDFSSDFENYNSYN